MLEGYMKEVAFIKGFEREKRGHLEDKKSEVLLKV